jgi:CBS-domain-containing membrane protein
MLKARDIMSREVITVSENATVRELATLLLPITSVALR